MESSTAQLCSALLSHFPERTVWSRPVIENCTRRGRRLNLMLVELNELRRDFKGQAQLQYSEVLWFTYLCGVEPDCNFSYLLTLICFIGDVYV